MNEPRVTAYWHAASHGLPCDLDWLRELGLRAWRLAAWYGIPPLKTPEGPYLVHTWEPWLWDLAAADMTGFYGGQELPVPGPDYPVRAAVAVQYQLDERILDGAYGPDEVIPPWCPLPQGDQALRDIGY